MKNEIVLIGAMVLGAIIQGQMTQIDELKTSLSTTLTIVNVFEEEYKERVTHQFMYINPIEKGDRLSNQLTSPYGLRTIPNQLYIGGSTEREHKGVDIVGTWHARVNSIEDGEIIDKWIIPDETHNGHPLFGGYVRIQHSNGTISGYGHLSAIYVHEGDNVKQGQLIGRTGNTGISTGEHLHLSIQLANGKFVNPLHYIDIKR